MKITLNVDGLAEDLGKIVSPALQLELTLLRDYVLPLGLSIIRGLVKVREGVDALREAVLDEAAEEVPDPEGWPYSLVVPVKSCEGCGFLTCQCARIDAELEGMATGG